MPKSFTWNVGNIRLGVAEPGVTLGWEGQQPLTSPGHWQPLFRTFPLPHPLPHCRCPCLGDSYPTSPTAGKQRCKRALTPLLKQACTENRLRKPANSVSALKQSSAYHLSPRPAERRPSCSVQSGGPCLSLGGELASACGHNRTSETGQPEFLGLLLQLEGSSSRLQQSETGVVWVIPRSTSLPFLQGSGCFPIPSAGQAQGCTALC